MNRRQFLRTTALAAAALPAATATFAANTPSIRPDHDGMLRVRGKREFILGLYQVPKHDSALREAAEAGFNLINRSAARAAYDEAHALGLWGWSALGSIVPVNRAEGESRIRKTIETLRDHPALLFWETEDEPTFVWKEPMKQRVSAEQINGTAAFIRRIDPVHPLYLNHSPTNLVPTLQAYNPGADIVATDIYPVIPRGIREMYALWPDGRQGDFLNDSLSQVGQYADKMRAVAGPQRTVLTVLQGFAWENLRDKDRDPAMVLYPSEAQLRFMAWQSVVHGVNGIVWWGLSYTPSDAPLWKDLRTVVGELSKVRDALAAPAVKLPIKLNYHDTGHSLDRGIEWLAKPHGHDTLLIAVNADGNPVDVTFEGLGRYKSVESRSGVTSFTWTKGSLRERFEPFGTRVWKLV
ncbi:MAG: hypothetical protein HOP33_14255 [Verrucomicrobia bacterium]|nr:hypothetical protein [Verrucomicrobiota bacterium]